MSSERRANRLINENSPYLLQHAYNPVKWYPWGEEALQKAKEENKLLLISIGYAACHWCHVMEHESFEDSTVAALMNEYFVNIKVDREERPDIDDIYMTACQMTSGRGCGWPLNSFALPDGRPVWAGTYFPKDQWKEILSTFQKLQSEEPQKLEQAAMRISSDMQDLDKIPLVELTSEWSTTLFKEFVDLTVPNMDSIRGGRFGAPKFPMPVTTQFLLHAAHFNTSHNAGKIAMTTLDEMAKGGIYDQLGGGFSRYSVDDKWLVPHFEKMLYDNGQLLSVYSNAFKVSKNELYQKVVFETIEFLQRELMSSENGFYSSLDADSEGEEGKFYVWNSREIDTILKEDQMALFKDYYNIKNEGNWEEGKNILHVTRPLSEVAQAHDLDIQEAQIQLEKMQKKLMDQRAQRVRPGLDDKLLCSWNGLALKGLVDAFEAFGRQEDLNLALQNARFIQNAFIKEDFRVDRNYKEGHSKINGFLDDYAFIIEAYIALYQVTFDEDWLAISDQLTQYVLNHFFDENSGFFFYTSDLDPALIARKKEMGDNVIPGSNSAMAKNLYYLGHLMYNQEYLSIAKKMVQSMAQEVIKSGQPGFYANWCLLYSEMMTPMFEVAILGAQASNRCHEIQRTFFPNALFLGGENEGSLELLKNKLQEGQTMIYVCQNKVCKLPVSNVEDALQLMQ